MIFNTVEYGQRPYFNVFFFDPFLSETLLCTGAYAVNLLPPYQSIAHTNPEQFALTICQKNKRHGKNIKN